MWLSFSWPVSCRVRSMNMPTDLAEQFFGSDRRTELTSALGFVADLVEPALLNHAPGTSVRLVQRRQGHAHLLRHVHVSGAPPFAPSTPLIELSGARRCT